MLNKLLNLKGSTWLLIAMFIVIIGSLINEQWDDYIVFAIFSSSFFIVDAIEKNREVNK